MHEEMRNLLNGYLDGELQGRRLQEMESHLASCENCRNELEELRLVSERMQADTTLEDPSAERFIANLTLNLPRRDQAARPPKSFSLAWWLVPAGLLMAWVFIQTVYTLTDVVTVANLTGLLGSASHWLEAGQESNWMSAATTVFGGQLLAQPGLSVLNNLSVAAANWLSGFIWEAVVVLLYGAWLGLWWLRRNPRPGKITVAG
jgi:anti-sigma factor RsiW